MPTLEEKADVFAALRDAGRDPDRLVVPRWGGSEWATLFAYATSVHLRSGSTLIRQQETDRSLYFLVSGALEAAVAYGDQSLAPLRVVRPGSVVGEVAFFDGEPRSAKVWAIQDSELLRLDPGDYDRFAAEHVQLANDLLRGLGRLVASRLRRSTGRARGMQ